jgi:hypothetical protein
LPRNARLFFIFFVVFRSAPQTNAILGVKITTFSALGGTRTTAAQLFGGFFALQKTPFVSA